MSKKNDLLLPEIWGGIECTIARLGNNYRDQLSETGHYDRLSDIGALADLGIRALRYPVLWERHEPKQGMSIDWRWADAQLGALRRRGIAPIVGLLHHGCGPAYTSLDSEEFAGLFASYAGKVAERYPWVEYYTPINEPLTTARFSGLYGIWYPHKKDALSFVRMLLHQLKGIVEAMKAIRKVNPAAKLVQTEDLAKVHGSSALDYQVDFENHRRWLTYDLLCGRVGRQHPLWDYLLFLGISEEELLYFVDEVCPPDIIGVNYYVTSERFLDMDLSKYPLSMHGGNMRHSYVDVEAVRAGVSEGLEALLREVHNRYRLPIAITEVHMNCTREEQVRWLRGAWATACRAIEEGMEIRAITAWALLGACDWSSLLTRTEGNYEPGAYSVQQGELQMTAVGHLLKELAAGRNIDHPIFNGQGWWERGVTDKGGARLFIYGPNGERMDRITAACRQRRLGYCRVEEGSAIWGVIELVHGEDDSDMSGFCEREELPYAAILCDKDPGLDNEVLDLFIDKAMEMASTYYKSLERQCYV